VCLSPTCRGLKGHFQNAFWNGRVALHQSTQVFCLGAYGLSQTFQIVPFLAAPAITLFLFVRTPQVFTVMAGLWALIVTNTV
jgi:hypothetical protein